MTRRLSTLAPALALAAAVGSGAGSAQSPAAKQRPFPAVPTTKVLAIGHITAPFSPEMRKTIMPTEVNDTVRLYLSGKIDQWYVRNDQNGVVFLMNVGTVEEAHAILEALPLGQAKLMAFDLIPIGPLSPLNILLSQAPPSPTADAK